ncbi:MAG TPA: alanine racemase [bacterium]|nr:alanine racemase [bacterium]HMW35946.1 alanine racemase [bacterium]HMY37014.1 alanine racemase [bacterium]HMZ05395.1 alanine racemase [bacterium]HNB10557.1 alanine racemase [bacterium]
MDTIYHNILKEIRPTHAVIDLAAIAHNMAQIRTRVGSRKIMAIVKANAYGHGICEVTQKAVRSGADYIGVGFLEEALFLRQEDIEAPILVMGGILGYQVKKFVQNDLEITVSSLELAHHINDEIKNQKARVHLKIDTGMERIGVTYKQAVEFVRRVAMLPHIEIVGLYSHFATADEENLFFAHTQFERYCEIIDALKKLGIEIPIKHIANSGAVMNLDSTYVDMVRPGISLYGMYPSRFVRRDIQLQPALSLKSKVVFIKRVPAGTGISYGHKYITPQDCNIVTVPIGYGDGYTRLLTNKADVLIRGKRYPVVGAVCMDQLMVNIGDDRVEIGDEVILIGRSGNEEITAMELAEKIGSIPYEITCMINARVPRIHIHK